MCVFTMFTCEFDDAIFCLLSFAVFSVAFAE